MKSVFRYLLFLSIFWFLIFFTCRIIFLLSVIPSLEDTTLIHALGSLIAGWQLDLSTIGYFIALPILLSVLYDLSRVRLIAVINDAFVCILIVIYCMNAFGELCLYQEWATKLNVQALLHFEHPAEVFKSATPSLTILFFSLVVVFSSLFIILYRKKFSLKRIRLNDPASLPKRIASGLVSLVILIAVDILLIRGGWKAIPISESAAYFSASRTLNDAAVNPFWSLGHHLMEYSSHQKTNPYHRMPDEQASRIMKDLFEVPTDSTPAILSVQRPNIVFVILESYSAMAVPAFGGDSIALFLDSLANQGVAFTNCFSSAYVSDQGIPAILSAHPSAPRMAIINQTTKGINLPCISKDLRPAGYQSAFYFGGQLNYGNLKSYLYNMKFDVIRERVDFPDGLSEGKLGIHDHEMAPLVISEMNRLRNPFIACWFTVSSHSPYDIPEKIKPMTERENLYVNTLAYTDRALKSFFEKVRQQPWYSNTLFVLVADHSHENQRGIDFEYKEFHRLPVIFYGDVIREEFRGYKVTSIGSQLDLVPTLLRQLNLDASHYKFAKNMLNPASCHFAYFYFFHGTGFVNDDCFGSFRKDTRLILQADCRDSLSLRRIRTLNDAFLQTVYQDYLNR